MGEVSASQSDPVTYKVSLRNGSVQFIWDKTEKCSGGLQACAGPFIYQLSQYLD